MKFSISRMFIWIAWSAVMLTVLRRPIATILADYELWNSTVFFYPSRAAAWLFNLEQTWDYYFLVPTKNEKIKNPFSFAVGCLFWTALFVFPMNRIMAYAWTKTEIKEPIDYQI